MATLPNIRGKSIRLIFTSNGKNIEILAKGHGVKEIATKGMDQVCGEKRGRPFKVTDAFQITYQAYQKDQALIDNQLAAIANDDADLAPTASVVGFIINNPDGTKASYKASDITNDEVDFSTSARADAAMYNSGFVCRYFTKVQATP